MSQENAETARHAVEAFNRRDRDAWLLLHDPEVEFRADPEWPESETVPRLLARFKRPVQGKTSRIANVFDYWCVFTFRSGKILRHHWFANRDQALAAVGLSG